MEFTRSSLEAAGFVGWVSFPAIRASACPSSGGVYVITYGGPTVFADRSCGGWFKGKDPTVDREALAANWVDGAEVVYIGKADQLKRRLRQFADFGAGKPVGHWGGRLIWQLPSVEGLLVAWKETPGRVPVEVEAELIAAFRKKYGKPPFANDPHLAGSLAHQSLRFGPDMTQRASELEQLDNLGPDGPLPRCDHPEPVSSAKAEKLVE